MTLPEAVETLREFRKLTLGPDLSLAIDIVCDEIDSSAIDEYDARRMADAA